MTEKEQASMIDIEARQAEVKGILGNDAVTATDWVGIAAEQHKQAQMPTRKTRSDAGHPRPKRAEVPAAAPAFEGIPLQAAHEMAHKLIESGDYPAAKMVLDAIR